MTHRWRALLGSAVAALVMALAGALPMPARATGEAIEIGAANLAAVLRLSSSYFVDRDFWLDQQRHHPGGLVAAVALHGGLVFAPAYDVVAVERLRFGAVAMYAGSRQARVSSALSLFKDGRWTVFQPPLQRSPNVSSSRCSAAPGSEAPRDSARSARW